MKKHGMLYKIIIWSLFPITATVLFLIWKAREKGKQKIDNDKTKLSKSINELSIIAGLQLTYMGKPGTNEKGLFESLEGLNSEDLKEVFNQFGKKNYAFGMYQGEYALIAEELNLFQWYNEELSEKDLTRMRAIWAKTGLTF